MGVTEERSLRRAEDLERLAGLRLIDDDFMSACFDGEPACVELVLRILLDMPELTVLEARSQVKTKNLLNRDIIMDVVALDGDGRTINVEIQRSDRGAGSRRARYHSSILDASLLEKGSEFDDLPETYVIFITERDVLGRGRALYPVERCVLDTGELFHDGAHILYVNGAFRDGSPVGRLMHDFFCTSASDMHYGVLAERVRYFKESEEGNETMCRAFEEKYQKGRADGREEGRQEGRQENQIDTARSLLLDKVLPAEMIAKYVQLPLEEVRRLEAELAQ